MPGEPCAAHPAEVTFVRCGRCDKPICVRCMVDSPVGKKCRECARVRTHLSESTPRQATRAFVAALVVALVAGWVMQRFPLIIILAFPYGFVVAEAALRAGEGSRSTVVQVLTGLAALIGGVVGAAVVVPMGEMGGPSVAVDFGRALRLYPLIVTAIGVAVAVSRIRFL